MLYDVSPRAQQGGRDDQGQRNIPLYHGRSSHLVPAERTSQLKLSITLVMHAELRMLPRPVPEFAVSVRPSKEWTSDARVPTRTDTCGTSMLSITASNGNPTCRRYTGLRPLPAVLLPEVLIVAATYWLAVSQTGDASTRVGGVRDRLPRRYQDSDKRRSGQQRLDWGGFAT